MSARSSKKVIYAALLGNALVAVTKFVATALTGSSAMFSEAIHSVVDTGNQILLLYGLERSKQRADSSHPFGYGMELYFWTFVVAILIFGLGSGISIYEGIDRIRYPQAITDPHINYIVPAMAIAFEAAAWWVAYREFRHEQGDRGFLAAVRDSKDPTVFTVLFEDSAAMAGLVVALFGVAASVAFEAPELDGLASIVIGLILAAVAATLAYECKGLLIGEGVNSEVDEGIRGIIDRQPGIKGVNEVRTMHMGPEDVLLNMSVDFEDALSSGQVEDIVSKLEKTIKGSFPQVTRVFIEAQRLTSGRR